MKRPREPYLPETVKQALASAKRLRKQLYNARLATPPNSPLWHDLRGLHEQCSATVTHLKVNLLPAARTTT